MTNAVRIGDEVTSRIMSLSEFINYDNGTDARYKLEDGTV